MAAKRTRKLLVWTMCLHVYLGLSQTTFQKTFGGPGQETANSVAEAADGFVVAGQITSTSGNQDALLIRFDASCNPVWQKRFGAGQSDAFYSVLATADGGFIAVGETSSFGSGNADIFVVKVTDGGTIQWCRTIGDASHNDVARAITAVPGGGFVISGLSVLPFDTAPNSIFIRLDANGNTVWSKTFVTSISNLIYSNYIDGNVIYASGGADGNAIYLRLDLSNGEILSSKSYEGAETEALYYQQPTADGNLLIADHTHSAQTGSDIEFWIQKINRSNGNVLWSKVYYRSNDNIRGRIEKLSDGGFLLVPYDDGNTSQADAILAKIDANGNLLWSYNYGGSASDRLIKAIQTADGGIIAVGDTKSNNTNGTSDILIVKTSGNGKIQGSCSRDAGIQTMNFTAGVSPKEISGLSWTSTANMTMSPLPLNLAGQAFNTGQAPSVSATIPLCPNQPINIGGFQYFAPKLVTDTVSNAIGCDTIYHYNLTLTPFVTGIHVIGLCYGQTYNINGVAYTAPNTVIDTIPSVGPGCDTLYTFVLKAWAQPLAAHTINFCHGESVMIAGQSYTQPGVVQALIPSKTGGCDTLVTYTLVEHPQPTRAATVSFCPGESVLLGGQTYSQPGVVQISVPSTNGGCDTLVVYTLQFKPQPTRSETIKFCPGESVMIAGQAYSQPGTVTAYLPSHTGGCDTVVTYNLQIRPQISRSETVGLCPGQSVTIAGQSYSQPGTVVASLPSLNGGCDTIVTYTLEARQQPTRSETRGFCPGQSVIIAGQVYNQPGTVTATTPSHNGGCDTIVTYTLELRQQPTRAETRSFCPGETVKIAGQNYAEPGVVTANIPSSTGGCDTIVTYTLVLRPQPSRAETRGFCPGESVTIAGQTYTQPGTVTATVPSHNGGCDTIVTYTLELRPQPTRAETRSFCPGESVIIAGHTYTQPGTVVVNAPSTTGGCDTIVTYTLQNLTPAPSNIAIHCPNSITMLSAAGAGSQAVQYAEPIAASDCICPGLQLNRNSGPASGSLFPMGTTEVCYTAKDNCGQEKPCCFNVTLKEETACDVKINGCMKYEVLTITTDSAKNITYRIRVTNSCSQKLIYTAIQVPDGVVAMEPANNSYYVSKEGRTYIVRSPNYTPMYSIRFKSLSDSIANGQSEVFEFTLPAQTNVTYFNITSRLANQAMYEAHLNTFNCPIGSTPKHNTTSSKQRDDQFTAKEAQNSMLLFPNPTSGVLYADLSDWQGQKLKLDVTNTQGQVLKTWNTEPTDDVFRLDLPEAWTNGIYFLELNSEKGEKEVMRFMIQK